MSAPPVSPPRKMREQCRELRAEAIRLRKASQSARVDAFAVECAQQWLAWRQQHVRAAGR